MSCRFGEAFGFDATISWIRTVAFVTPAGLGVTDASTFVYFDALHIADATTVAAAFVVLRRARDVVWIAIGYALLWRFSLPVRRNEPMPSPV